MTNILIVEDEQNLARFIELELTHENYTVDIENDGKTNTEQDVVRGHMTNELLQRFKFDKAFLAIRSFTCDCFCHLFAYDFSLLI